MEGTIQKDLIQSKNRWTGEVLGEVEVMGPEQVREVVEKSRKAQREWAKLSPQERAEELKKVIPALLNRKQKIVEILTKETGKPPLEALSGEIFTILESLEYAIYKGPALLEPKKISHRMMKILKTYAYYSPYGVVGLITPWNFPFFLSFGPAISALIAGNSVVIKPSEFTPLSVLEIVKVFEDAGMPENLVSVVTGYGETGEALIRSGVDKISFTGSVATGRKVASLCGELLIPVTMELGGKDPMIVLKDAPLERAVKGALWGGFCNSGQICASVERVYVEEPIYNHFLELLKEEAHHLRQKGENPYETELGPMNNDKQYEIVASQVEDALQKGAKALVGGKGEKPFFSPTILVNVTPEMRIYKEETFGPVVIVDKIKDVDEGIEKANNSPYGLTASIWTQDEERAFELANKLDFGFVFINDHLGASGAGEVSWGGFKESGFGKTRGPEGILEMAKLKYASEDITGASTAPYWFPYTQEKYERFSEVIDQIYGGGLLARLTGLLKLTWLLYRG